MARVDGHGRTLGYDHDAQGNRRSRSGPEGTTQYVYNARHQLTQVTPPGQGGIAITPSPAGRLRAIDPGNGVLSQYSHDRAGRLTRIEHMAGGGTVARVVYDLDSHGNRIAETVTQGAVTRSLTYGFDAADRLVRITAPDGETTWTLDGAGNRQTETLSVSGTPVGVRTYNHDARNQLTDIQDTAGPLQSFSYDAAGRQLTRTVGAQTWQHTWSAQDRLLSLTLGQGPPSVRYDYDADGQRIAREADGQRQQYVWDGLALQAQTNALGNVLASYTQAGRHTLSARHGSTTSHYHLDALGTPLALTAPDGTVQVRYQTDAWGNEQSASASHPNPIGFTVSSDTQSHALRRHPPLRTPGRGKVRPGQSRAWHPGP